MLHVFLFIEKGTSRLKTKGGENMGKGAIPLLGHECQWTFTSQSQWMPQTKKALQTLFRTYPAFISHLENESHSNPKAKGLAKMLEDCNIMTFVAFLQVF